MKKLRSVLIVCAVSLCVLSSCRLSTKQLTEEVKESMVDTYKKDGIKVVDLQELIHKDGNEYTGIVTVEVNGEKQDMNVDVVYDGNTFKWETKE